MTSKIDKESFSSDTIFTIGHSNHTIGKFLDLLKTYDIQLLADIRSLPRSKYNPQYNNDALAESLAAQNIDYQHFKELGGMRKPKKDTVNLGWTSKGFQGYADNMQSEEFKTAITRLIINAKQKRTAIMCAESLPWNCHRQVTADALLVRGMQVVHIMPDGKSRRHHLPDFAVVKDESITYPLPLFA